MSRSAWRVASLLALLITSNPRLVASSISVTEVPLPEVIAGASIIVLAKVEQIASVEYPNAKDDEPELRVFDLKVEDVLKPREEQYCRTEGDEHSSV